MKNMHIKSEYSNFMNLDLSFKMNQPSIQTALRYVIMIFTRFACIKAGVVSSFLPLAGYFDQLQVRYNYFCFPVEMTITVTDNEKRS
jgi:hypothetical protein